MENLNNLNLNISYNEISDKGADFLLIGVKNLK